MTSCIHLVIFDEIKLLHHGEDKILRVPLVYIWTIIDFLNNLLPILNNYVSLLSQPTPSAFRLSLHKRHNITFVGPERKGPYVTFCGFWDNWRNEFSISKSIIGVNIKTNGALKTQKSFFNFSIFFNISKIFQSEKGLMCFWHNWHLLVSI